MARQSIADVQNVDSLLFMAMSFIIKRNELGVIAKICIIDLL